VTDLQFTAALVNSLVWPVAVVIAAFLLRKELRDAFRRMLRLQFPGGAVDFAPLEPMQEVIAATAGDADAQVETPAVAQPTLEFAPLAGLAELAPAQAIVYAWGLLEYTLNVVSDRIAPNLPHGWPQVTLNLQRLDNWPLLGPAIAELRRLRDYTVETGFPPSTADALRYVSLAQDLVTTLRSARVSDSGEEDPDGEDEAVTRDDRVS
jgi:hypothetical protein